MSDRYTKLTKDPRFKKGRIRIADKSKYSSNKFDPTNDDRFSDLHSDKKFKKKGAKIDRTGKKILDTGTDLSKDFYKIRRENRNKKLDENLESSDDDSDEIDLDEPVGPAPPLVDVGKLQSTYHDKARGNYESEGSTTEEESSEEDDDDDAEDTKKNQDEKSLETPSNWSKVTQNFINETKSKQPTIYNSTKTLAFVNLDWTKISARDLYILCESFKSNGRVISCQIYKSKIGKEAEKSGPVLVSKKQIDGENEGENFDREKMREYELSKLRWRYAIIKLEEIESAEKIYEECNEQEYMSSGILMDISYAPDDMTFEIDDLTDEWPKSNTSVVTSTTNDYHPLNITHSSSSHTAIKSTFDEDDTRRRDRMHGFFEDFKDDDYFKDDLGDNFNDLIASSSSEEEDIKGVMTSKESRRDLYRKMLLEMNRNEEEDKEFHKSITIEIDPNDKDAFMNEEEQKELLRDDDYSKKENSNSEDNQDDSENSENDDDNSNESSKSETQNSDDEQNVAAKTAMIIGNDGSSSSDEDNENEPATTIVSKTSNNKITIHQDARFSEFLSSSQFSIDPSSKAFKKTDQMEEFTKHQVKSRTEKRKGEEEKMAKLTVQKRRANDSDDENDNLLAKLAKKSS